MSKPKAVYLRENQKLHSSRSRGLVRIPSWVGEGLVKQRSFWHCWLLWEEESEFLWVCGFW